LGCVGCGGSKFVYEDPFVTPRNQFVDRIHKIGLMPIEMESSLEILDEERELFNSFFTKEFLDVGVEVLKIPVEEADSLCNALKDEVGGLYDPKSGEIDLPKYNLWRRKLLAELRNKYQIDGVMFTSIGVEMAVVNHDLAKWHGTTQGVGKGSFLKAISGVSHSGTVPATVLYVELRDVDNVLLYKHSGGIQVLEKIGTYGGPKRISMDELFGNESRNLKAVQLAIYPLIGKSYSSKMGNINKEPDDFRNPD
jgi:hypothetical protein